MTTLLLLLLLMTPGDGVQDLLRQLGEDDAAVRATAVEKLISRGRGIVPELQAALVGQSDPEVRARIAQVLRALTRVRWLTDLESGRRKAAQEKKPLVVFSTAGPLDGFVWLGGHLMRTVTFADARVVDLLNEGYVVVWNNHSFDRRAQGQQPLYSAEEMAAYPEGGGGINLYTVIAAPDGTVLNVLTGYWSPETLLDELQFCRGLTPENRAVRQAERKNALRKQLSKTRETFPGEMGKRPKDSAVVRRMAALELLSQCHDPYSMSIPMGGIDEYLAAVAQRSKPRVISWG